MKYKKTITLKDGRTCVLRNGTAEAGKTVLDFYVLVHEQTDQLAAYADESDITPEQESQFLDAKAGSSCEVEILAEIDGAIVGLAATIYVSQNQVLPQASLSTAGIMFSYIVPVYMGMFIGLASNDVIGISIAAIGMAIFNYGLNCLNLGGGGWQQIIMGVFVMCFYTFSAQLDNLKTVFRRLFKKEAAA